MFSLFVHIMSSKFVIEDAQSSLNQNNISLNIFLFKLLPTGTESAHMTLVSSTAVILIYIYVHACISKLLVITTELMFTATINSFKASTVTLPDNADRRNEVRETLV